MISNFLNKNRADLDTEQPSQQVWERVVRCLDSQDELEKFVAAHRELFDDRQPVARAGHEPERTLNSLADPLEKFILENRSEFDEAQPSAAVWAGLEASKILGDCQIEFFIEKNRADFDSAQPSEQVWGNIEKALKFRNEPLLVVSWQRQLLRAAAAITLILSCFGAGIWYARSGGNLPKSEMALSDVSPEYAELEEFYKRDIAGKQEKLAQFASERQTVDGDIAQLDQMMNELKNELAHLPPGNREQVVRAMIENYKSKAAILEKVLEHLDNQQQQHSNSKKHEVQNI